MTTSMTNPMTSPMTTSVRGRPARDEQASMPFGDRLIELIAVVLLGITTIGTAWCGYQAAQWGSRSGDLAQTASDQHVEGARLFGAAVQRVAYDSTIVAQYAAARAAGNDRLVAFYRTSIVRPAFLPLLNRWEADVRAGKAPTGLTEDPAYLADQFAAYQASVTAAEQATQASQAATENASGYIATTILLAVALFFAGVTSSFHYRPARIILVIATLGTVAIAATRLADLPIIQ